MELRLIGCPAIVEEARAKSGQVPDRRARLSPEERRLIGRRAKLSLLLLLSPLLLFGARLFAGAATADTLAVDHAAWLAIWGMGVFGLAVLQLRNLFKPAPALTNVVLTLRREDCFSDKPLVTLRG